MSRHGENSGTIAEFGSDYVFLSNLSPHRVRIDGLEYPTAEYGFQGDLLSQMRLVEETE